jgi:Domain of unknown function (DUF4381)
MNADPTSLDRLHDVVAPPPVPWWPPAPGWYWVLGFLVAIALVLALKALIRWQHNRYRREALAELGTIDQARPSEAVVSLAELLKRTALSAWPRQEIAALNGPRWFEFLDRTGNTAFASGNGALLESATYDSRVAAKIDDSKIAEMAHEVRHWIKFHRKEARKC